MTAAQWAQVAELTQWGNGNQSDVIREAISRMYQQEKRQVTTQEIREEIDRTIEKLETYTARMDSAARKSSSNPDTQERLTEEVAGHWMYVRSLEDRLKELRAVLAA